VEPRARLGRRPLQRRREERRRDAGVTKGAVRAVCKVNGFWRHRGAASESGSHYQSEGIAKPGINTESAEVAEGTEKAAPCTVNGSGYATARRAGLESGADEMIIGRNLRPSPNVRRRLPVQKTSCESGEQEKEKRA